MLPRVPAFLFALLVPVLPALAHQTKPYDLNGGHYDDFGTYHCHLAGCELTESRYETRRSLLRNPRDQEKFYLAEDWPHWQPFNGCQNTRNAILANTSREHVTFATPRNCTVREGLWIDEYTGEEYTRAAELEIDHIIPPIYANASNGYQWDLGKRSAFANDPINLIPVARDVHRSKRERGIGSWRPPREDYWCQYAAAWRDVSEKYDLRLFPRDSGRLRNILAECETTRDSDVTD